MKKCLLLIPALACLSIALADNTASVKKELTANYKTVSDALKNNQIDKISDLLTDDYVVVGKGGQKLNKTQIISQFKMMAGQLKNAKWTRTIKTVTVSGKQAIAMVDGSFSGDITAQGQSHKLTQSATTKDTWVKTPKGYRLQKSEVQKNAMTMDGKPMPTGD